MPKKGKWSKKDRLIETGEEFVAARKQHSARLSHKKSFDKI